MSHTPNTDGMDDCLCDSFRQHAMADADDGGFRHWSSKMDLMGSRR